LAAGPESTLVRKVLVKNLVSFVAPIVLVGFLISPLASTAQVNDLVGGTGQGVQFAGVELPPMHVESAMPQVTMPSQLAPAQPSAGLVINGVFDSSITSDPNAAAIEAAFNNAVAQYQMMFTDPITVKILFRYSNTLPNGNPIGPGALGRSNWGFYTSPWATVINRLAADAKSINDQNALATIPSTAQTTNIAYGAANGRAMGANTPGFQCADGTISSPPPPGCDFDGIVTLVKGPSWSFSRPLAPNTYDAQRSIEHEINEVLGTGSGIDLNNPITRYRPLDLWTWSASGTRNVTNTGTRYFSLDSGTTNIVSLNQTSGGDFGDFISTSCPQANPYAQNAFSCPNQFMDISPTTPEGILLDVMGFDAVTTSQPSSIQFAASNFNVDEGGSHIDVTVTRTGDTSGTTTVDYSTFDQAAGAAHASQASDYEMAVGTLSFSAGETSKTFRVLVVDDKLVEGNETFGLTLSNATGINVSLASPSSATVTIIDNDTASTTVNPYDDAHFFVRQNYLDFLNREPDQSGWDFWTNEITQCGADTQCTEVKRINVSAAFFLSIEFQGTGYEAYLTHRSAFGPTAQNSPVPLLYTTFMHDVQELGRGYVFGADGSDAVLEANKVAYFNEFVARPEFLAKYPGSLTNASYVDNLLTTASLFTTGTFRDSLVNGLNGGTKTRATVLRAVAESSTLNTRELRPGFVTMEYFGYLRRDPDTSGFNFWLQKLNDFNGNYIQAEMVKAFIESLEDRQRFGNP
jgi:hypothetical protein